MRTLQQEFDRTVPVAGHMAQFATSALPAKNGSQACVGLAKILIVDDEPINIKAVEKHLRGAGYENLIHTADPREALTMIRREQPDLLLLDIVMPHLNGLDLLRQIRGENGSRMLPVIILTAHSKSDYMCEALNAGATDFLAKPVDSYELSARVRNTLIVKLHQDYLRKRTDQLEQEVLQQAVVLADARDKAELRYVAGKAEIASDVLHNVGNALHSVNVGVNLVAMTVRDSKLRSLKRATDLIQQHEADLPKFLAKDERGRVLPSYLVDLADALFKERATVLNELKILTQHLDHINTVVTAQQKFAALCNVTEEVPLVELLGDVEEFVRCSISRHGIEVQRDYQDLPPIMTDRQKLLQVLLNVLKNAVQAIRQLHERGMGRLQIQCGRKGATRAFIEVRDNGVGILPEHMLKIFSHGFTTKSDGHGFGLHSCANIMKELGGSIKAVSDGSGKGATFTLEMPFELSR